MEERIASLEQPMEFGFPPTDDDRANIDAVLAAVSD